MSHISRAWTAVLFILLCVSAAEAFDFSRYKAADLDDLLQQQLPSSGADIFPQIPLKISGTLVAYGETCQTGFLKKTMLMAGIPQQAIDSVAMTRCIRVRSAKGREVRLYIQDVVADALPNEVALGDTVTLFVLRLFAEARGPGLLVNEFSVGNGKATRK